MSNKITNGELAMANQLIKQRTDATRRTINTVEETKLRELRMKMEDKYGLSKANNAWVDKESNLKTKLKKLSDGFLDSKSKILAAAEAAKDKLDKEANKKIDSLKAAHGKKAEVIEKEIAKGTRLIGELREKVDRETEKKSHDIKRKSAEMKANLDLKASKLQEDMAISILPPELQATVKETPSIQGLASAQGIQVPALPAPPPQQ